MPFVQFSGVLERATQVLELVQAQPLEVQVDWVVCDEQVPLVPPEQPEI